MEEALAWMNGRLLPMREARLSIVDPAVTHGASVVDNARTWHGRLVRWPLHCARLRQACILCHIPLLHSDDELTAAAETLLEWNRRASPDVHLITVAAPGTVWMYTWPVDMGRQQGFAEQGARVRVVGHQPVAEDALLPPHVKHRSRMLWYLARQAAGGAVPLLLDQAGGGVLETDIASILAVFDGRLISPPEGLILESIGRRVVLELAEELGIPHSARPLPIQELRRADEIVLAGSGIGVVGVSRLDDAPVAWPGPIYQRLAAAWDRLVSQG